MYYRHGGNSLGSSQDSILCSAYLITHDIELIKWTLQHTECDVFKTYKYNGERMDLLHIILCTADDESIYDALYILENYYTAPHDPRLACDADSELLNFVLTRCRLKYAYAIVSRLIDLHVDCENSLYALLLRDDLSNEINDGLYYILGRLINNGAKIEGIEYKEIFHKIARKAENYSLVNETINICKMCVNLLDVAYSSTD